jgi:predicted porin
LSADTGNAAGFSFQRRSTVSLIGNFGEIRLGRDYVPTHWNTPTYDPFNATGVGSVNNTLVTLNGATTGARANNSVGYFLPPIGGVFGQVMVAAGEGVAGNKHFGGRIGYAGGPVSVAVAVGKTEVDSVRDFDRFNIGGSYDLSFVKLMFEYQRSKASGGEDDDKEIVLYLLGGTVPVGAGTVKFSYVKSDGKGALATSDASQIALGYRYDFSKRTGIYGNAARVSNKGTATYAVTGGVGAPSAGKSSSGYEVGLRHIF